MNIVFLVNRTHSRFYLVNQLHRRHPIRMVFFQESYGSKTGGLGRILRRLRKPSGLLKSVNDKLVAALYRDERLQQARLEQELFFGGAAPELDQGIRSESFPRLDSPAAVRAVREEEPDLVIVWGTSILRGEVLHIAKMDILNVHPAILPNYRGGGMPHWILYNGDFDCLGVTVHVCTDVVDGGDIIAWKRCSLDKTDSIITLEYRCTLLACELLAQIIDDYAEGRVVYRKQDGGSLWRNKDLTLAHHVIARRRLRSYLKTLGD